MKAPKYKVKDVDTGHIKTARTMAEARRIAREFAQTGNVRYIEGSHDGHWQLKVFALLVQRPILGHGKEIRPAGFDTKEAAVIYV